MAEQRDLYRDHLQQQLERITAALAACQCDHLWLDNGAPLQRFACDTRYPFRANPYLVELIPLTQHPHCQLLITPGERPRLLRQQRDDIWHSEPPLPAQAEYFQCLSYRSHSDLAALLPRGRVALISAQPLLQGDSIVHNPSALLNSLDYYRAIKSDYAIAQTLHATAAAARAHSAARRAFADGGSEREIYAEYLYNCGQSEAELPYDAIVATDQHAAVLHHTVRATAAERQRTLLLDAGASHHGYGCDITRTYLGRAATSEFTALRDGLDRAQQQLAARVVSGVDFVDLQRAADQAVAELLCSSGVVNVSASEALQQGLVATFFPHGVGHLLGVQVHDRGGLLCDSRGGQRPPPASNPMLRCTRLLERNMLVTIEPGIYFIEQRLQQLNRAQRALLNWPLIEQLLPCGGIRIEDNVVAGESTARNLTRELFAPELSL